MRAEHFWIDSSAAPGERIHLRQRLPHGTPNKALLFVHGATYPGAMFDVPGSNWMEHAAAEGYAAYALDVRGYGASTRGPALDAPARDNPPFARAEDAAADIEDAIEAVRERTGVAQVDVVGWSWGTMTCGMVAARGHAALRRLVLFAPVYAHRQPARIAGLEDRDAPGTLRRLGAYRTETVDQARERWNAEIRADDPAEWRDPRILDAWFELMLADEPADAVRAPNGVLMDLWEAFNARPRYDAGAIDVPTLVVRGQHDATAVRPDALGLFDALAARHKQYAEIGRSSHFTLLERCAPQLFATVSAFLAQPLARRGRD